MSKEKEKLEESVSCVASEMPPFSLTFYAQVKLSGNPQSLGRRLWAWQVFMLVSPGVHQGDTYVCLDMNTARSKEGLRNSGRECLKYKARLPRTIEG